MVDAFWSTHLSYAEAAKRLGCSRQNIFQQGLKGRIPVDRDQDGKPGIPMDWVNETLAMRGRDKHEPAS